MDEGINSFVEYEMCGRKWGYYLEFPGHIGITDEEWGRAQIAQNQDFDPIVEPAWKFWSGGSYARNSYPRTATVLYQLKNEVGEARFWTAFRAYCERWRFDHPASDDFFDAMEPAAGAGTAMSTADYRRFVAQTFRGTDFVDYRVLTTSSQELRPFTGYDDAKKAVNFSPDGKAAKKRPEPKEGKGPYVSKVVVARDGAIVLPVTVELTFANGRVWRTTWDGRAKWIRYSTTYASKLVKVVVDPERKIVLDKNPFNNARYGEGWKGASASRKATTYAAHLAEILVSSLWMLM